MQLQAIADVAPVVTMATEAISEMTPNHSGHHFNEVLSQKLSPRNEVKAFVNVHGYHGNGGHVANDICSKSIDIWWLSFE
jgi:hypothetical protein